MSLRNLALASASPLVFVATLITATAASAQATPTPQVQTGAVDTIVVTAQKRTQSLQNVPIVVTTVSRQLMQDSGVKDIKDLALLTPGLVVTSTSSESSTTARIRGIGTVGDNIGLESSVGVVIDGVYRPRNGVGFGDLGDLDRIEVLKGPQGTLFGKSTSAGVINILTAEPSFKFGGAAEFTAGNYGAYGGSASVTGPLYEDKLAGSLFFSDRQRDGYYKVETAPGPRTRTDDQTQNFYTLRGQLLYEPNSQLKIRTIADYSLRQESCCAAVQLYSGATTPIIAALGGAGGGEAQTPAPFNRVAYSNRGTNQTVHDAGFSTEANYKLDNIGATLTSITAYREWKSTGAQDTDFTTADIFYRPAGGNSDDFKTFSQEVRLSGTYGKLDYTVGGFYSHEDLRSNFELLYGDQFTTYLSLLFSGGANPNFLPSLGSNFTPGTGAIDHYHQTDNTYAIFTNDTLHLTDKLELNVGLRYTEDDKVLNSLSTNTNAGAGCAAIAAIAPFAPAAIADQIMPVTCLPFESPGFNNFANHQKESEGELSGTVKLSYRFNPQVLTYASYARGYKAGGFNLDRTQCAVGTSGCAPGTAATLVPLTNTSFPGEFVNSYEAGVKSTLLHRTLILNATAFYQDFTHFQLNTFTGLVFVVDSVPEVVSQGIDTDFVWLPTKGLSFQGGLTIADTRFQSKDLAALTAGGQQFLGSSGSRISLAPAYSASLSGTYSHDLTDRYKARFNLGMKYSSSYNTGSDLDPRKVQKGFAVFNSRLAVGPKDNRWAVELWAENLFDQHYIQVAFDAPFQNAPSNATGVIDAFLGAPRTYGVTLRAHF